MMMSVNFFSVIGMDYLWNYFIHAHTHIHTQSLSVTLVLLWRDMATTTPIKEKETIWLGLAYRFRSLVHFQHGGKDGGMQACKENNTGLAWASEPPVAISSSKVTPLNPLK